MTNNSLTDNNGGVGHDGSRAQPKPKPTQISRLDSTVIKGKSKNDLKRELIDRGRTKPPYLYAYAKEEKIGKFIRKHVYEIPVIIRNRQNFRVKPKTTNPHTQTARKEEYQHRNAYRAKNSIAMLAQGNFANNPRSKFLTLTLNNDNQFDIANIKACNHRFQAFICKLKRRFGEFRYIAVPEYHKNRDAIHYHLLMDLPYTYKDTIAQIWGHGFIDIRKITNTESIGGYFSKYLTKNASDDRFIGHHLYITSTNLIRPTITHITNPIAIYDTNPDQAITPTYTSSYQSRHNGKIRFYEYNLYKSKPAPTKP